MSKRTITVGFLTVGLSAGVVAAAIGPAAAQGTPVGGSGSYYLLSGAGNAGGVAQKIFNFGNPGDETYFGDWDGNGTDTPMVRRGNTFLVSDDAGQLQSVFQFGDASDKQIIVGDWTGSGRDSLAIVRNGNQYFIKNDVRNSSGVADKTFTYGNVGEQHQLVGDFDGDGTDTIAVQRGNQFYISNTLGAPKADYVSVFGDASDAGNVLVGNWATSPYTQANPGAGQDGDGKDRLAIRRAGNHYYFSGDLKDGALGAAASDFLYGDPSDVVFAAKQVGHVLDASGKPMVNSKLTATWQADVQATYKAGDPLLQWNKVTGKVVAQTDTYGNVLKAQGGEAKVHFPGEAQLNVGTEPVLGPNGKPIVYTDNDGTVNSTSTNPKPDANHVLLPTLNGGKVDRYAGANGKPVLDAQGALIYFVNSNGSTTLVTWSSSISADTDTQRSISALADSVRYYTPKVGEPVLQSVSSQKAHSPSEQGAWTSSDSIVVHDQSDYMLDSAGKLIPVNSANTATVTMTSTTPSGGPFAGTSIAKVVNADGSVTFSVTGATPPSSTVYGWVLTDKGNTPDTDGSTKSTLSHTFSGKGDFPVSVTLDDGAGNTATLSATVTFAPGTFNHYKTYADDAAGQPAKFTGTIYKTASGTTYNPQLAAHYKGGEAMTHRAGEVMIGWTYDGTTWVPTPLDGSLSATAVYSLPGADGSAVNGSTKLQAANATNPAPQFFNGTEPVTLGQYWGYQNVAQDALDVFNGGEAVLTHKAGDQKVDADGNPITSGDDQTYPDIHGDGLGVRRNIN